MKRRNETRRSGVVLLLILGLMAMFAISVLSYMVVTSNMAETAQNAQKLDSVVDVPPENDLDAALRNLVIGSSNGSNPIGPFSILENMYGNWTEYDASNDVENAATEFTARIAIFPNLGYAILTPCTDFYGNDILSGTDDYQLRSIFSYYFENSGNVMTLMDLTSIDANFDDALAAWNADVVNSSAYVLEKVTTDPSSATYKGNSAASGTISFWLDHYFDSLTENNASTGYYTDFDFWHFKIELTDDLKKFVDDFCSGSLGINDFNRSQPKVAVRLNRPAFSGTGAGGFAAGAHHDSTFDPTKTSTNASLAQMNLPYAFWMNASAPDMWPYYLSNTSALSFRSYWAHLTDVNYDPTLADSSTSNGLYYGSWVSSDDHHSVYNGYYGAPDSVRMNPSYTAPDAKTPFLAHYYFDDENANASDTIPYASIIPSFHRPGAFQTMSAPSPYGSGNYLDLYRNTYSALGVTNSEPYIAALLRKLTPRPLPIDHWNFTGGNPDVANFYFHHDGADMTADELATTLGNSGQWDVDNDNDGVREGIWIPSGLPIRYDKNGTPYATMFSYTVLDLDGRVNVNTAGNWDQLPNKMRTITRHKTDNPSDDYIGNEHPYNYVDELDDLWDNALPASVAIDSPFGVADNLNDTFGWNDDLGDGTSIAERGSGFTASGVLLYEAIAAAFGLYNDDTVQTVASNLLWRRNLEQYNNPTGNVDTTDLSWDVNGLVMNGADAPQPGCFYNGGESDDSLSTRYELFKFFDPVRLKPEASESFSVDDTATLAEAKMVFPWRGKTTLSMTTQANLAPAFDWADTAFRSYDPLGAQVYGYAPRYSNNPQLAYQNVLSWQDSPYSLPMLERLLRPTDADVATLPSQLVDDLRLNSDFYAGLLPADGSGVVAPADVRENIRDRARARMAFTTLSSDVPAASVVFPENFEENSEVRYGNYGFVDLIRRNVRSELERVFEVKGICQKDVDVDGYDIEGTNILLKTGYSADVFDKKVDEITAYLASMLPKEILAGEKIDLNALAQKNYWLDVDYDASGNLVQADRELHNAGLVKRMEYARGLYLVVMTLLYEDMNAHRLHDANDDLVVEYTDEEGNPQTDESAKLSDYIEGSFDLLTFKDDDKKKDLMGRELMATRIAQWCVNVVDFSDPDATMTPFFFDPTPFDGWWVEDYRWIDGDLAVNPASGASRWAIPSGWTANDDPRTDFLFPSSEALPTEKIEGLPTEQMYAFFLQALNGSGEYIKATNNNDSVYYKSYEVDPDTGTTTYYTSNELVAKWMKRKIERLEDQTSDLGFRLVWGMERPDLVLTETLNFHDLGIANTEIECDVASGSKVGEGDLTFDQVRRPEGSSYLELYCTANPNVPQSNELYDYVGGSWKLNLSRFLPKYVDKIKKDDGGEESREIQFPVWRVAISDSTDPKGLKDAKDDDRYQNHWNSVLDRLKPYRYHDKESDKDFDFYDVSFFSMQPRQFRNAPMAKNSTFVKNIADLDSDMDKRGDTSICLDHWKDYYDLKASNILGPAVAETYEKSELREVELDRILWFAGSDNFGDGGDMGADPSKYWQFGMKLGVAGKYPDALRTFVNTRNTTNNPLYLKPNQYLVVGPQEKRSIGSVAAKPNREQQQFGLKPDATKYASSYIDLKNLQLENLSVIEDDQKYQYMEAVANVTFTKFNNVGHPERGYWNGFNISEPLWTAWNADPYYANPEKKIKNSSDFYPDNPASTTEANLGVRDVPFETPFNRTGDDTGFNNELKDFDGAPLNFFDNRAANYPIIKDQIFGLGTIPAYKSAFVQRVADPNRPYHPVMNPYITVDWNMMDLTVFTGETVLTEGETLPEIIYGDDLGSIKKNNETKFAEGCGSENKIELRRNPSIGPDKENKAENAIAFYNAFSSRQWGSQKQKTFAPGLSGEQRPNPWSRAFKMVDPDDVKGRSGLEKPSEGRKDGVDGNFLAMTYLPTHTLGFFNDHGDWGHWATVTDVEGNESRKFIKSGETPAGVVANVGPDQYENLNAEYQNATGDLNVYRGAPRKPFEHLVWNDAPFSNPYELILVPASAPGRFGLEFYRSGKDDANLGVLYDIVRNKKKETVGSSLGSSGIFGFKDWYTDENTEGFEIGDELKGDKVDYLSGYMGPYLNFFVSSNDAGETLNLANILDLVRTPSYYLGARKLAGVDSNGNYITDGFGNTMIYSAHRDTGKVNINTMSKPVWHALVNTTDRLREKDVLPGTPWDEFISSRIPFESFDEDGDGKLDGSNDLPFTYFQPAYTTPLWVQLDRSTAPIGSYSTLLAQQNLDTNDEFGMEIEKEPLFDNVRKRAYQDDDGNDYYWYRYKVVATDEEVSGTNALLSYIESLEGMVYDPDTNPTGTIRNLESGKRLTPRRGNLYDATAEMQRLSGLTTTRSNVFAAWVTVGYFEVERCRPGVNMPAVDPDGNPLTTAMLTDPGYKWYHYYQAIYPDGFTYGKELGEEFGETKRHRGFSIIDRSIPVDFRRGNSVNYEDVILLKRVIE